MSYDFHLFLAIASFVLGTVIGSFLNVVIVRLPREESIVSPRSRCPKCGSPIGWYDNIPILSYLFLRGHCRYCGSGISPRYFVTELVTGLLFLAMFLKWGLTPSLGVYWIFCAAMIAIFWIDLEHMIIPDVISLNCIPVGISAAIVGAIPGVDWKLSLIGTIVGTAMLWLPAEIYSRLRGIEGLGGGDIKLLGMIGAFTGPSGVLFVLFVSSTIGAAVGLLGMATRRTDSTTPIPFGPFLTLAALLYVLAGQEIVKWSLGAVALA